MLHPMDDHWLPRISASCPGCGEVDLSPRALTLHLPIWLPVGDGDWTYRFECPACGAEVCKPLTDRDLHVLVSAGVRADFQLDGPLQGLPENSGSQDRSS
jgi:hypothetical protein